MKTIRYIISTCPHEEQRYDTVGDWINSNPPEIVVSEMNPKYEFLVAIHELIEQFLCKLHGIAEEKVNDYDMDYEDARKNGSPASCGCFPSLTSEPGNDKHAPYFKEHQFATKIERLVCKAIGVNWDKYNNFVDEL